VGSRAGLEGHDSNHTNDMVHKT
jgi:hypothetical protein